MHVVLFVVTLFSIVACTSRDERGLDSINKFSDPTLVKVYDFQDRRLPDSLVHIFNQGNLFQQQDAILAFGSVQDTSYTEWLLAKMSNNDSTIRSHVAFALGQTKGSGTPEHLLTRVNIETNEKVRFELFDALGKTASRETFSSLTDSLDVFFPWLCYRYGLREECDEPIVTNVNKFLAFEYPLPARLGAAHFFARAKINVPPEGQDLIKSALNDTSPEVRMASAAGLKNLQTPASLDAIGEIIREESDYRVRVNAVRSIASFPFQEGKEHLFRALKDEHVNVGIAAAETIRSSIIISACDEVYTLANMTRNWRIQAILLEAVAMVTAEKADVLTDAKTLYSSSTNNYQKAALLQVMAQSPDSFEFIKEELLTSNVPVIKSAAATALVTFDRNNNFPAMLKESILQTYIAAIGKGDVAVIGIVTDALVDSALGFKSIVRDIEFLRNAKSKLSLPRDYESYEPLERAIAYFEERSPNQIEKNHNHPIDWNMVKKISRDQLAIIKTSRGDITIRLLIEEAPGSVANFVELVEKNYYDGKVFHRVAPNFVIQGGCPRGDGWGSEDYSIRSEFSSRRYKEGSVGMASAGKDTEGVQWFITHSPTPHLDGRYTIFAEVTNGMDVVHKIEVGDIISDIRLLGYPPQ
jgi:cyclophilin family peptidyl-prolyl cis-trans isomerase/HEAT repeat protein